MPAANQAAIQPESPPPPLLQNVCPGHPAHTTARNPDALLRNEGVPEAESCKHTFSSGKSLPQTAEPQGQEVGKGRGWTHLMVKAGRTSTSGKHLETLQVAVKGLLFREKEEINKRNLDGASVPCMLLKIYWVATVMLSVLVKFRITIASLQTSGS